MTNEYKNRRVGLIIFGIIQILIGAVCVLAVPVMVLAMFAQTVGPAGGQMGAKAMIPGMLVYLIAAVWFIWLGIGSLMSRRWARALILVTSWMALIGGIGGMIFWFFFAPQMYAGMASNDEVPKHMMTIIRHVTTAFMALIYVVGPGTFVLFYRSRHVKATCDASDPKVRWTDRCPLPVLALVVIYAFWGISMLSMSVYGFAFPFFGTIITGVSGALFCSIILALSWWAALGMYRLKMSAWWTGTVMILAFYLSAGLTFSRMSLMEYYELMGLPAEQLELMRQIDISPSLMLVPMLGSSIVFLGYLLYVRRFFRREPPPPQPIA